MNEKRETKIRRNKRRKKKISIFMSSSFHSLSFLVPKMQSTDRQDRVGRKGMRVCLRLRLSEAGEKGITNSFPNGARLRFLFLI